jgi:anaerobic magnesium-protoporphyrin IX monomethyl ester cyclase
MKILFLNYDNEGAHNPLPMGACYVAAYLKKHGYTDIQYYSQDIFHYPEEHLTEFLSKNKFDLISIGFVAGYFQHNKIIKICKAINKAKNRPFIVLAGHGPTPIPEFYLEVTGADAVLIGEGELPLLNLVKALENNISLSTVKGIAYRDGNNYFANEREKPITNLDTIPFPDYDSLPMEYYINGKVHQMKLTDRMIAMISSRGCTYHCNFCQRLEKGYRLRSIPNIIEEIKKYIRDYGITYIHFYDELFMFSEKRVKEFTDAILDENIKINYFCTGRLEKVNENMLRMLKESGCSSIDYGIEQFDNYALQKMDKQLTEDEIIRGIELTKNSGIKICFNIIFGNIGDTRESLKKSTTLLKKYNDFSQLRAIRPVTPYPGTPLYYYAIQNGFLKGPADFYKKHTNLELLTTNFTDIPDDEFYQLLFNTNKEIIEDYYEHLKQETISNFHDIYLNKNVTFRGVRHI